MCFALRVVKLVEALPRSSTGRVFGDQLLRSDTSVAANYRAARRGRSSKEFVAKLSIVTEEADEATFWLELIGRSGLVKSELLADLQDEAWQLTKIFASTRKTASKRRPAPFQSLNHPIAKSPD